MNIFTLADVVKMGLLTPGPGEGRRRRRRGRRILHLPPPPPARPILWSGERGRDLKVQVWARAGRLICYCRRGDAWTSDPHVVFDAR